MRQIAITGIGLILNNCDNKEAFWQQIKEGRSQLSLEHWPEVSSEPIVTGRVQNFHAGKYLEEIPEQRYKRYPRELQMYLASVFLARDDAGLRVTAVDPERIGLFDSSSRPGQQFMAEQIGRTDLAEVCNTVSIVETSPGMTVGFAASLLKIRGPAFMIYAACSGGAVALGNALQEMQRGEIDVALVTGHENPIHPVALHQYSCEWRLQSQERRDPSRAIRPFTKHGTALGEGAVTLVLEAQEHAEHRGAKVIAMLKGLGYGNNGGHVMRPDVEGVRPAEIMTKLLRKTGVEAEDIGFVVAHGNGVEMSDRSEQKMMRRVFQQRSREVPLVSNKPIYGHLLGASSTLNAAQAALMLSKGFIPPTINVDEAQVPSDITHQANMGAAKSCKYGLAVSFGMGGHNSVLLFGR